MTRHSESKVATLHYQLKCLKLENDFLIAECDRVLDARSIQTRQDLATFGRSKYSRTVQSVKHLYGSFKRASGLDRASPRQAEGEEGHARSSLLDIPRALPVGPDLLSVRDVAAQVFPRILIDVSDTAFSPYRSGIQRYVREFAREAYISGGGLPVIIRAGLAYEAYTFHVGLEPINLTASDTILLIDSNWDFNPHLEQFLSTAVEVGTKIVVLFFDVIPYLYEYTCDTDNATVFRRWFKYITPLADAIVTCSETVLLEIEKLLAGEKRADRHPSFGWVPVGTNLDVVAGSTSERIKGIFAHDEPVFISVGTLEPRKGFPIALDAFEQVWASAANVKYIVIGKAGWGMRHFEARLRTHANMEKTLFWLDDLTDADLIYAYENATCLVMPSIAEGFGIPLIEAAQFGLRAIASDIPIFREVVKDPSALFFDVCQSDHLAKRILQVIKEGKSLRAPDMSAYLTWPQCVETLTDMVRASSYQKPGTP